MKALKSKLAKKALSSQSGKDELRKFLVSRPLSAQKKIIIISSPDKPDCRVEARVVAKAF